MTNRYDAGVRRLAAEARSETPPPDLESALLRQFDRRRQIRRWRPVVALVAVAAAAGVLWFIRPQPAQTIEVSLKPPAAPWETLASSRPVERPRAAAHVRPAAVESDNPFVAIPYVAPLDPYERVDVVRIELPVSALIAAGLQVETDDAGANVQADVVVGQDGRARAVRLVSNVN